MSTADTLPRISFGSPAGGASTAGETSPATGFSLLSPVAGGQVRCVEQEVEGSSPSPATTSTAFNAFGPAGLMDRMERDLESAVADLNAELAMLPPKFLRAPSPAYLSIIRRPEE